MVQKYNKAVLLLKPSEKNKLKELLRKGNYRTRTIKRAQLLLAVDKNHSVSLAADILGTTPKTAYNILDAYRENGLEYALYDLPRCGKPHILNEKQDSQIVALACSTPPEGRCRWTVQLLLTAAVKAKIVMKISRETVRTLMKNHALKPWREKMWCVAKLDNEYIEKMEDVLSVYEKPYNKEYPVVCMDEKPVQLLSEPYNLLPAKDHQLQRRDHEYKREGVANVFCAIEPKTGKSIVSPTKNRKAKAFAQFIFLIALKYKNAKKINLVMDNLNTHCLKSVISRYGEEKGRELWRRFNIHHTPKHASWLNQAEIGIGIYTKQCLGKERVPNFKALKKRTVAWKRTGQKIKINWRFTRKKARLKFKYKKCKN